ncbi:undecaprenyl-diphosphatase UppP [Candidatus Kaiserbacteria bacterium]|nr:undecaprenyl-diphosphatase UppP [Candidatus Kaiserbacteria bacterium]
MEFIVAAVLGLVQGITEFLPVSSTGHLILARAFLGVEGAGSLAFDAILHLATALAAVTYFRRDIWLLVQTFLRYVGMLPVGGRDVSLLFAVIFGTIPAAIAGLFLEELMETVFRSPLIVAAMLVAGAVLLGAAEYVHARKHLFKKHVTVQSGVIVGLFQTLALIPGVSRSGASISGGLFTGLTRADATRFAFLLAIPVLLGAGVKKTLELLSHGEDVFWAPILFGALVAFAVGFGAIHFMITYLRRHTFWPFIWYRVLLAAVVALLVFAG